MDRAAREAIPGPLASWRPLWDHAAAIGARFVIIDPVALAGQWDGYSALPVGAFIAAIRRELRALTDPCGALLVCHTTKAARFGVQEADRTGAEAIIGSGAWVDRARAALMLDAIQNGDGPQAAIRCESELRGPTDSLRRAIRESDTGYNTRMCLPDGAITRLS